MRNLVKYIVFLKIVLCVFTGIAQEHKVIVVDSKTGAPVPFAHVMLIDLETGKKLNHITDGNGYFPVLFEKPVRVEISCMSYQRCNDTLQPSSDHRIELVPAIFSIDEVVVTAQYKPERADKSIYKVKVINNMKIRQKAASNLADLLNDDLSIRIGQDGALGSSMSIRGLSGEHVKFLIDGVPVIGRMNGNIDVSQINLNNVDHIEIIEGPMSVKYGSNALAGVVNVITKESTYNSFKSHIDGYYESVGVYNINGGVMLRNGRHTGSVDIARNFFGGYSEEEGTRHKTWKPKRQVDFNGFYSYNKSGSKLKLSGKYFDELLVNKGDLLPPYYELAFDNNFITRRGTARAEFKSDMGGAGYMDAFLAYSTYKRIKETYLVDLTTLEKVKTVNDEDQDTSAFSSIISRGTYSNFLVNIEYQWGWEIQYEMGEGKRITDKKQTIGDYAGFLSLKYMPSEFFSIQPGLRYGHNTNYTFPLVYSLSLKWDPGPKSSLRASYARGFRAPSLKELYLYFVDINHNIQGNENLEAEYSHNVNLNYSFNTQSGKNAWGFELTGFYNDIENIITLALLDEDLYTYVNLDNYKTAGGQFNINYNFYPALSVKAGLAETGRSSNYSTDEEISDALKFSTDFTANASWRLIDHGLEFAAFYKYTGKLPQYYVDDYGELSEGYIESFHLMDITISKFLFKNTLTISGGVKNMFDNKSLNVVGTSSGGVHSSGGSYLAGWGRTFFLKATWTFNKILKNEL